MTVEVNAAKCLTRDSLGRFVTVHTFVRVLKLFERYSVEGLPRFVCGSR